MRRTIFHALLSSGLLAFCVVVVGLAIDARLAHPAEAPAVKGDLMTSDPPLQARPAPCKLPIAALGNDRVLTGKKATAYIAAAGAPVAPGTDTVAYKAMGPNVVVMFAGGGCVTTFAVVPEKEHRRVMLKALGLPV